MRLREADRFSDTAWRLLIVESKRFWMAPSVLRSPLFGFSDQDLFDIAADRGRKTLRTALAEHSGVKFAEANARLETLAFAARRETPFVFFAHVLGAA